MAVDGSAPERDLRVLAGAIGLSALGDGVALVALMLAAKDMAGSGMSGLGAGVAIAVLCICLWAPVVVLAGHVGLLVDRVETRGLLVAVSAAQAVVGVGLAFAGSLPLLFVLAAVAGCGIAIAQAAEFALVPRAAGGRSIQQANSLVESTRSLGFAFGPVCGSLLVAAGGRLRRCWSTPPRSPWSVSPVSSLVARRPPVERLGDERRRARDGIGFLLGDRLVAIVVVVVFVSLLFMSASIPADVIYVEDVLGVENLGLGIVFTGWTLGMLVGANVVARRVSLGALATAVFVGVTIQGLGKFLTPFWLVFAFMVAMYFVGGIGHGLKNVTSRSLIHARIAPERHGRAFAAWNGIRNGAELGALAVGGIVVGAIGARETLWLAGGLSALAGVVGLAVLAWRRGGAREVEVSAGTIGSP